MQINSKRRLIAATLVILFLYTGHVLYLAILKNNRLDGVMSTQDSLVIPQTSARGEGPRSDHRKLNLDDPDRNKEDMLVMQIRQIFKSISDGRALLEQEQMESDERRRPFSDQQQLPDNSVGSERRFAKTTKHDRGPDFRSVAIGFPTSNAPRFVADLERARKIADVLMSPDKSKLKGWIGLDSPDNDGCFRPPEPRKHWKMVSLVKSWVVNDDNRAAIRDTWASVRAIDGVQLVAVFLVARAPSHNLQLALEREQRRFGDILQIDVPERIELFTERLLGGMKWVTDNFPANHLYSSVDDNMIANIDLLTRSLNKSVHAAPAVAGPVCTVSDIFPILCVYSFREADPPGRRPNSPWSIDRDLYPPNVLPGHCQGGFYTTAVATVRLLTTVAVRTRASSLDAMWITGVLRQKLGMDWRSVRAAPPVDTPGDYTMHFDHNIANSQRKEWKRMVARSRRLRELAPTRS